MKRIFLKDIAKELKVSKTTISLVLNNKGDENKISKETQRRIIAYAKKHNYVPNQLARGLSRGKSETIGLIIPNISDIFYARIARCVERKAKEFGYTVVFSSSDEDPGQETELIHSMLNRQVEGLIIASTQKNRKEIKALQKINYPFVLIDRHYPGSKSNYVIVDNYTGTKTATEHLIKLGRRRIGLITLEPGLEAIKQRLLGYQDALRNARMRPVRKLVKELGTWSYPQDMKQAIEELLDLPNPVDAIVFSTHYLTALGLRVLKKCAINVPEDVAIVSFDEMNAFDLMDPPITSVIQPVADIGNEAVEILMHTIESKNTTPYENKILKTRLEIRKSCGAH